MRMSLAHDVQRERAEILRICENHGVARAGCSAAWCTARPGWTATSTCWCSARWAPTAGQCAPRWWPGGLIAELADLLACKVDIVTEAGLHPLIRTAVHQEAKRAMNRDLLWLTYMRNA